MHGSLRIRRHLAGPLLALAFSPAAALGAADFPPVTAAERALTEVPGHPGAPVAVLYRKGDLDLVSHQVSSVLTVEARLKILTEEGKERFGEVEILHSRWWRLRNLRGRTVLPDGTEVPLPADSVFERRLSKSRRVDTTSVAFPSLAVGAIIDYRYEVAFDSLYYLEPWVFQEEVPVLHSEIVYRIPRELAARGWQRDPLGVGLQQETKKGAVALEIRIWADNLPPILDEPESFPPAELSARFMLVPTKLGRDIPLLDTWESTCEAVENGNYGPARRNNKAARARARELAPSGSPKEKAQALFRFVRDEIATEPWVGVLVDSKGGPDRVLAERRGDYADKAMLLHSMLDGVGVKADLVWAASRWDGRIDPEVPSFGWFDRVLVRAEVGGGTVFLDPGERSLGFGQILADYEGTTALRYDRRKPEVVTLPASGFADTRSEARIDLTLGEDGRLAGRGSLAETGHWASQRVAQGREGEGAQKLWTEWLERRWPGFSVREVRVEEKVEERRVEVSWALEQAAEEALGDEASLFPSRPLGPLVQPLPQPVESRRTPVMLDWPYATQVELSLTWPPGWEVEAQPPPREEESAVGSFSTGWKVEPAERRLSYSRRLEVRSAQVLGREDYAALRSLYDLAAKSDAQALVLVRP